jgi:ATP-dependent RNA helicase CshB
MTFDETNLEDLDNIASVLNDARFMFFSATFSDKILPTMKKYITNVEFIDIKEAQNQIKHIWIPLKYKDRYEVLKDLLGTMQPYLCMIFCNKKDTVIELAIKLSSDGYFVGMMHGDLSQRERKRILKECNELKYQFLVCTDIAARGIDIKGVSHIINYELPRDYEFYLHRSGRTGRMFNDGIVYSFYEELDNQYLDNLNKKDIKPEYFEIKNKELVPFKGRNSREARIKPKTNYELEAKKFVPKSDKVKPGYKKKREEQIKKIAESLKKRDKKRKK